MPELADILDSFCRLDGVHGALVLEPAGHIREERFSEPRDTAPLAEVVRRSLEAGSRLAEVLQKGSLGQQYVEFANSQITSEMLQGGQTLVVVADTGANLGRIRLEIRKNKKAVEGCLA